MSDALCVAERAIPLLALDGLMNFTIRTRLTGLTVLMVIMLLVLGLTSYRANRSAATGLQNMVVTATALTNHQTADMMHDALRSDVMAALLAESDSEWADVKTSLADHAQTFRQQVEANKQLQLDAQVQQALAQVGQPIDAYIEAAENMVMLAARDKLEARQQLPAFQDKFEMLEDAMENVTNGINAAVKAAEAGVTESVADAQRDGLMVIAAAILLGVLASTWIARGITRSINELTATMRHIQQSRNLSVQARVNTGDEIQELGEQFNGFVGELRNVISEVRRGAAAINHKAVEVSEASDTMAGGASEQAAGLEEVTASLANLSGFAQQTVRSAREANQLSIESQQAGERGTAEVNNLTQAMSEIQEASGQVAKVNQVIDEIAFQINLLALNAAVEAARAGEAGRGFAVVAEEVRNLAQRSAAAARETADHINTSTQRAQRGGEIAKRVNMVLRDMVSATQKVDALLGEIAQAVTSQASTVEQISSGVASLDNVTQQTAASAQALAGVSQQTAQQVQSLNELVGRFVLDQANASGVRETFGVAQRYRGEQSGNAQRFVDAA